MSTVDKATADKVVNGEYPEDGYMAIVMYENKFDRSHSYKLCRNKEIFADCFRNSNMINPVLYWVKEGAV